MATFAQIKSRVSTKVIDLPSAVQAELPKYVNAAMRKLQNLYPWKVCETLGGPYVTATGTRVLTARPSNWKEPRSRPFRVSNIGGVIELTMAADRSAAYSAFNVGTQDIGPPQVLLEAEESDTGTCNIEVFPLPDGFSDYSGGQYRIYIPYNRYLPDLAADGDQNWFTINAEEYLVKRAVAEAFFDDWDENRGTIWAQRAQEELHDVVLADKRAKLAGVDTLVPHWRGANAPRVRR